MEGPKKVKSLALIFIFFYDAIHFFCTKKIRAKKTAGGFLHLAIRYVLFVPGCNITYKILQVVSRTGVRGGSRVIIRGARAPAPRPPFFCVRKK